MALSRRVERLESRIAELIEGKSEERLRWVFSCSNCSFNTVNCRYILFTVDRLCSWRPSQAETAATAAAGGRGRRAEGHRGECQSADFDADRAQADDHKAGLGSDAA